MSVELTPWQKAALLIVYTIDHDIGKCMDPEVNLDGEDEQTLLDNLTELGDYIKEHIPEPPDDR